MKPLTFINCSMPFSYYFAILWIAVLLGGNIKFIDIQASNASSSLLRCGRSFQLRSLSLSLPPSISLGGIWWDRRENGRPPAISKRTFIDIFHFHRVNCVQHVYTIRRGRAQFFLLISPSSLILHTNFHKLMQMLKLVREFQLFRNVKIRFCLVHIVKRWIFSMVMHWMKETATKRQTKIKDKKFKGPCHLTFPLTEC